MAYCAWKDVAEWLPEDWRSNSDINSAARRILEKEHTLLNARLGERYIVPFTLADNPEAYAWAKVILAKFVCAHALLLARAQEARDPEEQDWAARLLAEANEAIENMVHGEGYLSDAEVNPDEGDVSVEDGYDSLDTTDQEYLEPWFTRQDEW